MANSYYTHGSLVPAAQVRGTSAAIRAEFDAIALGFTNLQTDLQARFGSNPQVPLVSVVWYFVYSPQVPTAAVGDNTANAASTAFVQNAFNAAGVAQATAAQTAQFNFAQAQAALAFMGQ